ncbi:MAG: replication-relaxation family protein [Chloroflexota bacterium]|nr:replication-relaxation family protein [Chloroflexota bacterium]
MRDLDIMCVIGRSGIASFEQLYHREWAGKSRQTCADRLLVLKRAGWLTMHYTDARGGRRERVYALTRAGQALLPATERERVRVGLAPSREHMQQLLAQDYRLVLEQRLAAQGHRLVDWLDERELKSAEKRRQNRAHRQGHNVPAQECADARAVIQHADGQQQQLEIEIDGHYYGKMLKNKMSDLAALQRPVVYVCLPGRLNAVRAAAAPYADIHVESL